MFAAEGYELALVGGPVRDLLLHRRSHDLDFCTSARPEQFEPILRRFGHDGFWDMGRKFGTLGAMRRRPDGTEVQVEVTTYRTDAYNPDSRKPEVAYGDTLEGDLSRRDFTVNALAYNEKRGLSTSFFYSYIISTSFSSTNFFCAHFYNK